MKNKRTRRNSLLIIITLLTAIGFAQAFHRHYVYEVPWIPGSETSVWSVEARVQFTARGDAVTVNLRRPVNQPGFSVLDEGGASPGYGLNFVDHRGLPTAQWTIRQADGRQTLYYRVEILQREAGDGAFESDSPPTIRLQSYNFV